MIIKLYEKFTDLKEVKDTIFMRALETNDVDIVDFFVKRNYDMEGEYAFLTACHNDAVFRYFLAKGVDPLNYENDDQFRRRMRDLEVQKALIDFDYEVFIYDTVGFNSALKQDPKYADVVNRFEVTGKYNL